MSSNIVPFSFETHEIRVVTIDETPWFVAADVCAVLSCDVQQTRRLDDDEKGLHIMQTPGGNQQMSVVNESGLYSLILTSRKPEAKKFKKWVTAEVLPAIRKTGSYSANKPRSNARANAELTEAMRIAKDAARLARAMGLSKNMIALSANAIAKTSTGIDILDLMGVTHLVADERGRTYTPSELGKMLTPPVSGHKFNLLLEAAGLQAKEYGYWMPTDAATGTFEWLDTGKRQSNGTPVKQIKWFSAVLDNVVAIQEEGTNNG